MLSNCIKAPNGGVESQESRCCGSNIVEGGALDEFVDGILFCLVSESKSDAPIRH